MKKFSVVFGAFLTLFLVSCEGPSGPPGFDGLDGLNGQNGANGADGVNILASVIDIEGTFSLENDYTIGYEFPDTIEVFETDVVLVYLLWGQTDDAEPVDIWRLMPQTRILDQGLLQYNYDHTFFDVSMFLEADFDLASLPPGDTNDQVFRIAVLPGESLSGKSSIDRSNINEVMRSLSVDENDISRIKL